MIRVVSHRIKDKPRPSSPSTVRNCRKCGEEVWFSRGTAMSCAAVAGKHKIEIVCIQCSIGMVKDVDMYMRPTEIQIREISKALGIPEDEVRRKCEEAFGNMVKLQEGGK